MALGGWSGTAMLQRYSAATRQDRAIREYRAVHG